MISDVDGKLETSEQKTDMEVLYTRFDSGSSNCTWGMLELKLPKKKKERGELAAKNFSHQHLRLRLCDTNAASLRQSTSSNLPDLASLKDLITPALLDDQCHPGPLQLWGRWVSQPFPGGCQQLITVKDWQPFPGGCQQLITVKDWRWS